MSMRTPLGKVRGLGSAHEGTEHFWRQRVTGLAMIPLTLVFVSVVIATVGRPHAEVVATLGSPVIAVMLLAMILAGTAHMRIGMQVIIEDYVHGELTRLTAVIANTFFCALVGLASIWAVVKLSFGI
jgi:succinate dehydrogenase / fumarate reductase membrane anchor subunit